MKQVHIFAIAVALTLVPALTTAFYRGWESGPWEKHDTDEGLVVYLNESAHSDVPAVRVDGTIDAPAKDIFEVMIRHDRARDQADVVAYDILETRDDGFRTYQRIDPTGIGPRDFILRGSFVRPKGGSGSYAFRWKASSKGPKPKDDVVRVKVAEGVFALEPIDDDTTRVSYRSLFDPKVPAPGFVIRRALVSDAVDRVVALRRDVLKNR
jgi:hypothetical protein